MIKQRLYPMLLCATMAVNLIACSALQTTRDKNIIQNMETDEETYPVLRFNLKTLYGYTPGDMEEVVEAMNVILRNKAHAEIEPVIQASNDQLSLMLNGGDDAVDLYSSFLYLPLSTLVANGQAMALDDLLDDCGQELKALFKGYDEVLDCGRVSDKLYGIPTIIPWVSPNIYICRKSDIESAGVDLSEVTDLNSLTTALLAMKKANPNSYYISGSTGPFWYPKGIDYLGDTNYLGVIIDPENGTKVENYYESDYFINFLDNVKIWMKNDLISPDSMSNPNGPMGNYQYNIVRGTTGYVWSLEEFLYGESLQHSLGDEETVGTYLSPSYLTTSNVTTCMWHISPFCKDPKAAMRVLNLFYTNPELSSLLCYGIKDKNWVVNSNGLAEYPEGKEMQTAGWIGGSSHILPNCSLNIPWWNQSPDVNEKVKEANQKAIKSVALGFNPNLDVVADQVAACENIIDQYYLPLINGVVDIDEVLPEFQKALHVAGVDDIIEEKQRQFDEWKAK